MLPLSSSEAGAVEERDGGVVGELDCDEAAVWWVSFADPPLLFEVGRLSEELSSPTAHQALGEKLGQDESGPQIVDAQQWTRTIEQLLPMTRGNNDSWSLERRSR